MLIQMPIIFGLFTLLRNPLYYMGSDERMMFAVHQSFLWMPDLSQPDKWLLPILAGIATFISFSMQQQQQPDTGGGQMQSMNGMMKMMKYVFPIMIVMMGRSFPAGLTIYWSMSQVIQIFFNMRMNKMRERIMAESAGKKKKGGKK